jgi:beta-lactamase class A
MGSSTGWRALVVGLGFGLPATASAQLPGLQQAFAARIAKDTASVGVALVDLANGDTLGVNPLRRFHAASTMKVPVLIELCRRIDAGDFRWSDSLTVTNRFHSIVDGSEYSLNLDDDSDSTLYAILGRRVPIRTLARLMIVRSSNLATNLFVDLLGASRINATAHALGADSIQVLRGVEDQKAYDRGLNNTTTARDLAVLLAAIQSGRAASPASTEVALGMLKAQEFNSGIPAGLPPGTPVAHKTGWLTSTSHDAAIIYPPGRPPYVLVILTRGYQPDTDGASTAIQADEYKPTSDASRLMADLSRMAWDRLTGVSASQ